MCRPLLAAGGLAGFAFSAQAVQQQERAVGGKFKTYSKEATGGPWTLIVMTSHVRRQVVNSCQQYGHKLVDASQEKEAAVNKAQHASVESGAFPWGGSEVAGSTSPE